MAETPKKKPPEDVEFLFEESPDFKIAPANGVWGGITTKGDFRIDFFVETLGTPDSITYATNPDGTLGPETKRKPPLQYIRRLQVGVLMSIDVANSLAGFIKDRIAEFEKLKEELAAKKGSK